MSEDVTIADEIAGEMWSEAEFCEAAEAALDKARRALTDGREALRRASSELEAETALQAETADGLDGPRLTELEQRTRHAERRIAHLRQGVATAEEALRGRRQEHQAEVARRRKAHVGELVDELHRRLLHAKEASDRLLKEGLEALQCPWLTRSPSTGKSPLETWRAFATRRLRGDE